MFHGQPKNQIDDALAEARHEVLGEYAAGVSLAAQAEVEEVLTMRVEDHDALEVLEQFWEQAHHSIHRRVSRQTRT